MPGVENRIGISGAIHNGPLLSASAIILQLSICPYPHLFLLCNAPSPSANQWIHLFTDFSPSPSPLLSFLVHKSPSSTESCVIIERHPLEPLSEITCDDEPD